MKSYWISWYGTGVAFELHSPWWITGYSANGIPTLCAAIRADDEDDAKRKVIEAHDEEPGEVEWRFVEERPDNWSPFGSRFPRAEWMQW